MKETTSLEKVKVFLSFILVAMVFLMGAVDKNSSAYKFGTILGKIWWIVFLYLIINKIINKIKAKRTQADE